MAELIDFRSPLPGTVLEVIVKKGDRIEESQPLLILESMKMENEIFAESGGVIEEVFITAGQKVGGDEILMQIRVD
ncbi:MAG: biotin/lipoyl-containing protein [Dehalococcoidales bacterium]